MTFSRRTLLLGVAAIAATLRIAAADPEKEAAPVVRVTATAPKKAPAAASFPLTVELKVTPPYHIYPPGRDQVNIPTSVTIEAPPGFVVGKGVYPKPIIATAAGDEIEIYEGTVRIVVPVTPPKGARGAQKFQVKTRYQACTADMCLPPETVQHAVTVAFDRKSQ